jgi:hypothetical protein
MLHEPYVVEGTVEIFAPVLGKEGPVFLRAGGSAGRWQGRLRCRRLPEKENLGQGRLPEREGRAEATAT